MWGLPAASHSILDRDLHIESVAIGENEWSHNITITSGHQDVDCMFGFHYYDYESVLSLALKQSEIFVLVQRKCLTEAHTVSNFLEDRIAS